MGSLFLHLFAASCFIGLAGCASKQAKSSSRIYEGDSPGITYFSERETAGGPIVGR